MTKLSELLGEPKPFKDTKGKTPVLHLLVDGDIFAWKAAAVCDGRTYTVGPKSFVYKKDAVAFCSDNNFDPQDIKVQWITEPVSHAYKSLDYMMKIIKHDFRYEAKIKLEVFLTPKENWRYEINPTYKMSRKGLLHCLDYFCGDLPKTLKFLGTTEKTFWKNFEDPNYGRTAKHVKACKKKLVTKYKATYMDGREADDALGIRYTELVEQGKKAVIVSIDKDLDCIPGHHYNTDKEKRYETTGEEALFHFYHQCLTGDKTDSILGCPGVGQKGASSILEECDGSDLCYYEVVLSEWMFRHKLSEKDAASLLGVSARCLWIQRYIDEYYLEPDEYAHYRREEEYR